MPTVDGIVSGLNTSEIIKAVVAVQAVPRNSLQSKINSNTSRVDKLGGIKSRLETISAKLAAISTTAKFAEKNLTNSDTAQLTASISNNETAIPGNFAVQVTALAKAQVFSTGKYAPGVYFSGGTEALTTSGTYEFTWNATGEKHTFTITAGETVDTWINKFNQNPDNYATAALVDRGPGVAAGDRYEIAIFGNSTGADNSFTLSSPPGGDVQMDFAQVASDATMVASGMTVTSDTNTFQNVLPGISITANALGASAAQLTVTNDNSAISGNIQDFVSAYNDLINYYKAHNTYDAETGARGALFGESSSRQAIQQLGDLISGQYAIAGSDYDALSWLGVETNQDGTLALDTTTLSDALENNFDDVSALFTAGWDTEEDGDDDGPGRAIAAMIDDLFVDPNEGIITSATSNLEALIEDQEERVDVLNVRLTDYEARLREQYTLLESNLARIRSNMTYITAAFGLQNSNG